MLPISDPDIRRRRFPVINVALIAICALVFVYELALNDLDRFLLFYKYGLVPWEITNGAGVETVLGTAFETPFPNWVTLLTSMFLHGDWMHFLSNMLFLWTFGNSIESRFGHIPYILFYLATGLAAGGMQIAVDTQSPVPVIGASGAIAGVLGAYFLLYPFSRIRTIVIFIFITFVRIPAVLLIGFWVLLQFIGGLGSLDVTGQTTGGVAYWAHIGGFVAGITIVFLIQLFTPGPHRNHPPSLS